MDQPEAQWRPLGDVLKPGQALAAREAAAVIAGVLRDLARFHAAGAAHGAVDPAHVQIAGDRSKLADAGTATAASAFTAPERHAGQPASPRSDIFSAGAVFYLLLTGRSAFDGPASSIQNRVSNMIPPAPSAIEPRVPVALDAVLERAMAKKPEDRFATVQDFARALGEALAAVPASRSAAPPPASGGDDATVVRPAAADATVFQPVAPVDATVYQPAGIDATVVRPAAGRPGPSVPASGGRSMVRPALLAVLAGLAVLAAWLLLG